MAFATQKLANTPTTSGTTLSGNLRRGDLIAGKYRVEGTIGEGGMGIVLYAVHVDLDLPVAIKVVRDELAQREEIVARMLREAKTAATIRSEHAGRVLDAGRLPTGTPFIAMEYLDGFDLCTLIEEQGRLPIELAVDFILQASEAVAEAHASGIIHRDLKPENLFLTNRIDGAAIIKVLDFGISKNLNDREGAITNATTAVGSPFYMSPEQMRLKQVDARSDIWSLGAILYELLTGYPPFNAETIPAVCVQVMHDDPIPLHRFNPDVSEALEQVVLRCLQKHPDDRYPDVGALAAALVPHGSAEAPQHAERIQRVVTGSSNQRRVIRLPSSVVDRCATTEPSLVVTATPTGHRLAQLPSGSVLPSVYTPRSSVETQLQARRRGIWMLAALTLLGLGSLVLFMITKNAPDTAPLAVTAHTESRATAHTVPAAPIRVEPRAATGAHPAPERTPSAHPTSVKAPPRRSAVPSASPHKPAGAPAASAPPQPAPSSSSKTDAWNTDAFGGRG